MDLISSISPSNNVRQGPGI